jgi:hypothetical protein
MISGVSLSFSGIVLNIEGMARPVAERMLRDWRSFVIDDETEPFLTVEVSALDGDAEPRPFLPKDMASEFLPGQARFSMNGGEIRVDDTGRADLRLARGLGTNEYHTLMNLLRAGLAWRLPARGAALLHAAGIVVDGRAFLLVGAEGSGKSTWALLGEQAGATVLSDDLVLVDGGAGPLEALGSPLRSTHRADYRPGRWPVAAILFPRHGERPAWRRCPGLETRARLAANLPFVCSAPDRDSRVFDVVERLATAVPCRELTFGLDPTFVELLRSTPD